MEEVAGEEDRDTEQGIEAELPRGVEMGPKMGTFTSRCWTSSAGVQEEEIRGTGGA